MRKTVLKSVLWRKTCRTSWKKRSHWPALIKAIQARTRILRRRTTGCFAAHQAERRDKRRCLAAARLGGCAQRRLCHALSPLLGKGRRTMTATAGRATWWRHHSDAPQYGNSRSTVITRFHCKAHVKPSNWNEKPFLAPSTLRARTTQLHIWTTSHYSFDYSCNTDTGLKVPSSLNESLHHRLKPDTVSDIKWIAHFHCKSLISAYAEILHVIAIAPLKRITLLDTTSQTVNTLFGITNEKGWKYANQLLHVPW